MRRLLDGPPLRRILIVMMALLTSSCFLSGGGGDEAGELAGFLDRGESAIYAATYRFELAGPLAPAVTTRLEIVRDPPTAIRKLEAATPGDPDEPVTVRHWQITNGEGNFVCTDYAEVGVQCLPNPVNSGTFGSAQVDAFFDLPADPDAFSSVVKANRTFRVAGEEASCFEATAVPPTPVPAVASPDRTVPVERFRYELCYASDGVLLRGRRALVGAETDDNRRESLVEAVSVSRTVESGELGLPGPVVDPEDL